MAVCASRRECWLWGSAALVGLLILVTIPIATDVFALLEERDLVDSTFGVAFIVACLALLVLAVVRRPGWREVGVVLGIVAVVVALVARLSLPAERTHLFEYAVLGALIYLALLERSLHRMVRRPALVAVAVTVAVGVLDEVVQIIVPDRVFDWRDVAFNAVAAVLGVGAVAAVRWARRARR